MMKLKRRSEEKEIKRQPVLKRTPVKVKVKEEIPSDNHKAPYVGGHIPRPKECKSPIFRHSNGRVYVDIGNCLTRCAPNICEHAQKFIDPDPSVFGKPDVKRRFSPSEDYFK